MNGSLARRALLLILSTLLVCSEALAADDPVVIGTITIHRHDVFTEEESARGSAYQISNALHFQTRERVIRKLLLFREGEPFVAERLAQTERNLRAMSFLKLATVTAGEPHDGVVDIDVVVQDSWSTEPGLNFGSKGGNSRFGIDLTDANFLGTGTELSVIHDSSNDRQRSMLRYRAPSLFGPYWNANFLYADNSDGGEAFVELERPFFATETPWAFAVSGRSMEQNVKLYEGGAISQLWTQNSERYSFSYGRAFSFDVDSAHRLTAGVDWRRDRFAAPGGVTIDDRDFRYLFGEYQYTRSEYLKLDYVNRDLRFEDFNLGPAARVRYGISPRQAGADDTSAMLEAELSRGLRVGESAFVLGELGYTTRFGADRSNAVLSGEMLFVSQFRTRLRQTFLAHAEFVSGSDLDPEVQFFADGETGLRGYRSHAFNGDQRYIVNLEHRVFLGREWLHVLSPGAAIFVDAGNVAAAGASLDFGRPKIDAGLGLRLGLTRSPRNMIRVDLAWPFEPDALGRQGMQISISSSQAF